LNDSHTALANGFTYNGVHYTGDQAAIAQGDNFLSIIVPQIEASQAYKNNGAIIIWWDETEGGDDPSRKLEEIVISPLAKGNAYNNNILYTHSSDLLTMEELFGLGCVGGSCGANDLSDLFKAGAIPSAVPEIPTWAMMLLGFTGLGFAFRQSRRKVSFA
jgi:phosphatidylinositol-3-phosphatase